MRQLLISILTMAAGAAGGAIGALVALLAYAIAGKAAAFVIACVVVPGFGVLAMWAVFTIVTGGS